MGVVGVACRARNRSRFPRPKLVSLLVPGCSYGGIAIGQDFDTKSAAILAKLETAISTQRSRIRARRGMQFSAFWGKPSRRRQFTAGPCVRTGKREFARWLAGPALGTKRSRGGRLAWRTDAAARIAGALAGSILRVRRRAATGCNTAGCHKIGSPRDPIL